MKREPGYGKWFHLFVAAALVAGLAWAGCSDDTQPTTDAYVQPDMGVDTVPTGDGAPDGTTDGPVGTEYKLTILHTNDIHSHLNGFGPVQDYTPDTTDDDSTVGGMARMAAKIAAEKTAAGKNVLLLDCGDLHQGSLFDWLKTTKSPMLTMLQTMGYDATTLGNHDFEWTSTGLAATLDAATKAGFKVPIVASSLKFDATDPGDDALEAFVTAKVIVPKLVKALDNGMKVGIFGMLGDGAADLSPAAAPVTFEEQLDVAKKMIKELREQDKVDLVIAISHGGTYDPSETTSVKGDDHELVEALAKEADKPKIDLIVSGHSHRELKQPKKVEQTLIVQAGGYGRNLGKLELTVQGGQVTVDKYELIPIDDKIKGDSAVQATIDGWVQEIDAVLAPQGLAYNAPVCETSFDVTHAKYGKFEETPMGDLVADAFLGVYNALNPTEPAAIAAEVTGQIREPILKGKTGQVWLADLYRVLPLGIGPDGKPGYPLVTFYVDGKSLKTVGELYYLAASPLLYSSNFFPQISGMEVEYDTNGIPTMNVTSIKVAGQPVDFADTTTCYKIVANLFVAELLGLVGKATGGKLAVTPKEKDCSTVVTDMTSKLVDADPTTAGVQELKNWQALLGYVKKFPDADSDNIPDIPSVYSKPQGRIIAK